MLVRKRMASAQSLGELIERLAGEISDPGDRAAFRKELAKLSLSP